MSRLSTYLTCTSPGTSPGTIQPPQLWEEDSLTCDVREAIASLQRLVTDLPSECQPGATTRPQPRADQDIVPRCRADRGLLEEAVNPRQRECAERPLCLDFLKGKCKQNRYKCKFAHPAIEHITADAVTPAPSGAPQICDVWRLTGYCKFGNKCRFSHCSSQAVPMCCSPAVTKRSADGSRRSRRPKPITNCAA
eukprot:TRINITY_DN5972_c0_g1_i1.p1 TRINITY_DN5972_c0_g1~~TRINITY_DN5972_c0_g1_i1.p1  ORF type:complete len:201 (-),score=11.23 TRINITY_DN5972_c0_g1_i1:138-719(-)